MRHNAIIEIRSEYFENEKLSYRVEELSKYFPKIIEVDPSMYRRETSDFNGKYLSTTSTTDNNNKLTNILAFEMDRLQRQLFEAIRQGNSNKINEIKRQLEFYSTIEGRSVFIFPPEGENQNQNPAPTSSTDPSQSVPDDNYDNFIGNRSTFY